MTTNVKLCTDCKEGSSRRTNMVEEGTPTVESQFDGQFTQTFTRYRCTACHALWENELESGLRGSDSHWRLVESP